MRKIIVTGGAGFIGSHLVDRLINAGHKVAVLDNLSTGQKQNLNPAFFKKSGAGAKAKFYKVDICSPKISQIFKKEKPEIVYHFAARINVRESVENPMADAKINILGSLNVLESCRKFRVKKFIFPSSVGIYGQAKTLPIKETHFPNPITPYPITKLAIENYLKFYQSQGLNFVSLRYSNVYGPRQKSSGEGGVVAIFINKILKGERPIIFGSGNQSRDFLYVADAVEAAILAQKAKSGSVYNVGTNKEITVNGLLKTILEILNKKTKSIYKNARAGEIIKSKIDYSKIKRELKWQPEYNLEKGLRETIIWFKRK